MFGLGAYLGVLGTGPLLYLVAAQYLKAGAEIVVRTARPGERMTTLDGQERELDPDDLVIADRAEAISYAAYRVLSTRYAISPNAAASLASFTARLTALGFDPSIIPATGDTPAAERERMRLDRVDRIGLVIESAGPLPWTVWIDGLSFE